MSDKNKFSFKKSIKEFFKEGLKIEPNFSLKSRIQKAGTTKFLLTSMASGGLFLSMFLLSKRCILIT